MAVANPPLDAIAFAVADDDAPLSVTMDWVNVMTISPVAIACAPASMDADDMDSDDADAPPPNVINKSTNRPSNISRFNE